jgi:hypothetical protein
MAQAQQYRDRAVKTNTVAENNGKPKSKVTSADIAAAAIKFQEEKVQDPIARARVAELDRRRFEGGHGKDRK